MSDIKKRVEAAMLKHHSKLLPKTTKPRRNKSPERDVVKSLLAALNSRGFHVFRVESQSSYSAASGAYTQNHAPPGCPDILGTCPEGSSVYLEVKAPGRRSTLKEHQRDFLLQCIRRGGIGVCADSVQSFFEIYQAWLNSNRDAGVLISALPQKKVNGVKEKGQDAFGF